MDMLKLAILAFIAGGIVLSMANVTANHAILISAVVMIIVTIIAIIRSGTNPREKKQDNTPKGPTIK